MAKINLSGKKTDDIKGSTKKVNDLLGDVLGDQTEDLGIEDVVITDKENKAKEPQIIYAPPEKRDQKVNVYVTATEKKKFLKAIGRETESNVCRELILYTLGLPTNKPECRNLIKKLLTKLEN